MNLKTVRTVAALREAVRGWRAAGESVGLVPTMGWLHDGHMSLVRNSMVQNDRTVVSIFVNPKQFDRATDLEAYPRDEARDAALLDAAGADVLWAPEAGEMYPDGFSTSVNVSGLTDCLCGASRPGHFGGVAVVVTKLLLQCLADRAYFGRKDYQQLMVVRRMARDLNIPTEIRGIDTVRETDGLAMSSRNWYLTESERAAAPTLFRVLTDIAEAAGQGEDVRRAIDRGKRHLDRAGFGQLDYLEVRDAETLELTTRPTQPARAFAAVFLGKARLIDNVPVDPAA
ncbi:pantoate--beta-alanine ligase [Minwuia thermotolerans]|uniref:Pantothenate synthetase n=1 Tax=Minwuia thermotolerans TaxID=2056226 RepID=A0A2M9G192_9PROT|nr:pantoate--beta-alanine ligase [Minwuia thermotolerans]PJK29475.1 pantoate--beta-alanine ligase [Minwuia thermotolerans]